MSEITLRHGMTPFELRGWGRLGEALEGSAVQPVCSLEPGLVQVEGWVRSLDLVSEPRTKTPVVGYRMVVDGLDAGGGSIFSIRPWRLLFDASEVRSFLVQDQSGTIRVDATDALLLMDYQRFEEGRFYDVMGSDLIDFWDQHGLSASTLASSRKLRMVECLLKPDTGVFVFGLARPSDRTVPGTGTYREAPRTELVLGPFPSRGVVISDRRRADVINYIKSPRGRQILPRPSYLPGL